jgi:hypothetical protein
VSGARARVRRAAAAVRRALGAAAWLVVLVVGCVAAGGLVVALDHPETDASRPELTAHGGRVIAPRLAAMEPALGRMALAIEALAGAARDAFIALRSEDAGLATTALRAGGTALTRLRAAAGEIALLQPGLLVGIAPARLPEAVRERVGAIDASLSSVGEAEAAWQDVRAAASPGLTLLRAFRAHDRYVAAAADLGRRERYREALGTLEEAAAALQPVLRVRDAARDGGAPTPSLDAILDATLELDRSLTLLYGRLVAAGGALTAEVQDALDAVRRAEAALAGTDGMLAEATDETGANGIIPALLRIDAVRGAMELAAAPAPSEGPPPSPEATEGRRGPSR